MNAVTVHVYQSDAVTVHVYQSNAFTKAAHVCPRRVCFVLYFSHALAFVNAPNQCRYGRYMSVAWSFRRLSFIPSMLFSPLSSPRSEFSTQAYNNDGRLYARVFHCIRDREDGAVMSFGTESTGDTWEAIFAGLKRDA